MYTKLLKAVWFCFLVVFMASFMYVYASLPLKIVLISGDVGITVMRNTFFYVSLIVVLLVNMLAFLKGRARAGQNAFKVFILGQLIMLNMFFAVFFLMVMALNSGERFDPEGIGILLYASVVAVTLWALSGLGYFIFWRFNR